MATRGSGNRFVRGPRFGGNPAVAKSLNEISRRVDDVTRQAFTFDDSTQRRGGGKTKTKWVKITATSGTGKFNVPNSSLKCKDLDQTTQQPTGTEFNVYLISYGDTSGQIGMVDVAKLWPPLAIGDLIEVEYKKRVPHGTTVGFVTDWFVRTERGRAGCG